MRRGVSMKLTRKPGMFVLAVWLIAHALVSYFNIAFTGLTTVMALLVLVAGVLILLFDEKTA
jgi:hypothetical protein